MSAERFTVAPEPLSRQAWERVESRVFERLGRGEHLPSGSIVVRGPAPVRVWLGAAGLVLVGTVVLWWGLDRLHHHPPAQANVAPLSLAPSADLSHGLGAAPSSQAATPFAPGAGARMITAAAPARIVLGGAEVTLAAHSDVLVSSSADGAFELELVAGEVECQSMAPLGRASFVVHAGPNRVRFTGAHARISRSEGGATVSVIEGWVRVQSGARDLELGPGQRWAPL